MAKLRRTAISRSTVGRLKADADTVFWDSELQGFGVARLRERAQDLCGADTRGRLAPRSRDGRGASA